LYGVIFLHFRSTAQFLSHNVEMARRLLARAALLLPICGLAAFAFADPLRLQVGTFDPLVRELPLPVHLRVQEEGRPIYQIVQFKGGITTADRTSLARRGLEPVAYLPDNAYVVKLSSADKQALAASPRVAWIGPLQPGYKLSPELGRTELQTRERVVQRAFGIHRMTVTLVDGEAPAAAIQRASDSGLRVIEISQGGPRWYLEVEGPVTSAPALAQENSVFFIEDAPDNTLRNDRTTWVIQTNLTGNMSIWNRGLLGQGQIVGVLDSQVWMNHDMFRDPANNTPGPNHRKVVFYSGSLGAGSHGTHVAGTIAGDQSPITGSTFRNGIAYRARMTYGPIPGSTALYSALQLAYNNGARIHTNSWGNDGTTAYTAHCQQIDQFSWDFEHSTIGFAVTNGSVLRTPENAKSVLAVGNTSQTPNQHNPSSGGTGPTTDGRRKPEIWAPGTGIMSASSSSSTGFTSSTGTSMACPAIMGAAALVREYYMNGYERLGSATRNQRRIPSGALIRATIMNAGVDMTGMAGYPGPREGWGRLLLENALFFTGESRRLITLDIMNGAGLFQGGQEELLFQVTNPAEQLKITMSFTDWPAAINASFAPVNNVDLEVISPNGTIYVGNNINTSVGLSNAGAANPDTINSTEMVILNNPATGVWRARVRAPSVNMGTRQGFALVITGGVSRL
jgi:subtilisin family serine protease